MLAAWVCRLTERNPMFKPKPNPPGTVDVNEHERRLTESADALEKRGLQLLASDGRIDVATGNQCMTSAIKARAAASQLSHARIQRDHDAWIMEQARQLKHGVSLDAPKRILKRKTDS